MKVIHIAGYSGTGKTSFIRDLIPLLQRSGPVATVKHLGHHTFELDESKDTAQFFALGADISAGVDSKKSVCISRSNQLEKVLEHFCDEGIAYTIIEGFKSYDLPKVIIGDLQSDRCLLRNPDPDDVVRSLPDFPEMFTLRGEILALLSRFPGAGCLVFSYQENIETRYPLHRDRGIVREIQDNLAACGVIGARVQIQRNLFSGPDRILLVICARDPCAGLEALTLGIETFRKKAGCFNGS